jgi:hypothetical protein
MATRSTFEERNLDAYSHLLRIEVVLRELAREHWLRGYGDAWPKRLPGDLLKTIRECQREENRPHFGFECLGPLYYLTFGQLISVLSLAPSKPLVDGLGGLPFLKALEALSPMRNAVCHSRPIPDVGRQQISLLYAQLTQALTTDRINHYLQNPDVGIHPEDARKLLCCAFTEVRTALHSLPEHLAIGPVADLAIKQYWWRPDLAGFDIEAVECALSRIAQYNRISRGIGAAALRHAFNCENHLQFTIDTALASIGEPKQ